MSVWGDIAGGAVGLYGYDQLMQDMDNTRGDVNDTLDSLQSGVTEMTGFKPWGVTSNIGGIGVDEGGMNFNLSPEQLAYQQQQGQGASSLFNSAMQDPTARQQEHFGNLQAMRQPAMQQGYQNLQQGIWGSGTGGMQTATYGGDPQSYAFAKAMNDTAGQDMMSAQQMAMGEQAQQAQIGQQMFGNQYMPQAQLANMGNFGINNQQLNNDMTREQASLWSQLGLGGLSTNVNYDNIKGNAFGNMIKAGSGLASGLGNSFGETEWAGKIGDTVGGWFGLGGK